MRLDEAYENASFIPNGPTYPDKWAEAALDFREVEAACGRARLNQAQGDGQSFDLFLPSARPKGCVIYVHGGYWKAFSNKDWSHFAQGCLAHDWAFALISYPLAPGASLPEIAQSVRLGVEAVAQQVTGPISLVGHSAGGQLVARLLMADGELSADVAARLHHVVAISPVSDLRDLRETSMNEVLGLDAALAQSESPALNAQAVDVPVTVWVGAAERPKFLEQAGALANAWGCDQVIAPYRHHFDVIDDLLNPESDMVSRLTGGRA